MRVSFAQCARSGVKEVHVNDDNEDKGIIELLQESRSVNRLNGMWLKGFVWMVAIMLPFQPLAASHCSCCHSPDTAVVAGKNLEAEQVGCRSGRCGCSSKHNAPEQGPQSKVPFAPCDCPASCPCHLQHAPKLAVKSPEIRIEKCEAIALFVAPPQSQTVAHDYRQTRLIIKHRVILSESALELCAALCRFTI